MEKRQPLSPRFSIDLNTPAGGASMPPGGAFEIALAEMHGRKSRSQSYVARPSGEVGIGVSTGPRLLTCERILQFLLAVIAVVVMGKNKKEGFSFMDFQAFQLLFGVDVLVVIYAGILSVWQLVKLCSNPSFWTRKAVFAQLILDFSLMLLLFASATAGATTARQNHRKMKYPLDQMGNAASPAYNEFPAFCAQLADGTKGSLFCITAEASIAMTYLTLVVFVATFWQHNTDFYW